MRSISATDVPPNFITSRAIGVLGRDSAPASGRGAWICAVSYRLGRRSAITLHPIGAVSLRWLRSGISLRSQVRTKAMTETPAAHRNTMCSADMNTSRTVPRTAEQDHFKRDDKAAGPDAELGKRQHGHRNQGRAGDRDNWRSPA